MNKSIIITQREEWISDRGEVRDSLDQAIIKFLLLSKMNSFPIPNALWSENNPDNFYDWLNKITPDGIVLSGGGDVDMGTSRQCLEFKLLEWAIDNNIPVLGICRGMQLLAIYFGVNLVECKDHVNNRHELIIKNEKHRIILPKEVNSFHRWAISECPENFDVIARSSDGVIEAIKAKNIYCMGWMWHPEREINQKEYLEIIIKFFEKKL